jgi:hypothetical protein
MHRICCAPCTAHLQARADPCPVCRKPIDDVIRCYGS